MSTWQLLTTTWAWEPTVLAGCAAMLIAYIQFASPLTARAWLFGGGVAILALALVSPLDTLGDTYLFSVHMVQHLLLILAVPPLLLLGIPPDLYAQILRRRPARLAERLLGRPPASWLLGICTLWVWHLPVLYDAAVRDEGIHILQHLSFLVTATIFWWPVITPYAERRLGLLPGIAYLLVASFASSILGIVITFAPPGLYPAYQQPFDRLGILPLIRQGWGLSYAVDQQLGGVIMWVTGGPIYLLVALLALMQWFREPDADDAAVVPSGRPTMTPHSGQG